MYSPAVCLQAVVLRCLQSCCFGRGVSDPMDFQLCLMLFIYLFICCCLIRHKQRDDVKQDSCEILLM